jgi:hypothetical protein
MAIFFSANEPAVIERLARDLADIARGHHPGEDLLAAAPLITNWRVVAVPAMEPALTGLVHRHPTIADGHVAVTSRLLALDIDAGWARTWSRVYRLGRAASLDAGEALQ